MQKAVRHYADLRTARGQKAAQEAWETPVVEARFVASRRQQNVRHGMTENGDPLGHVPMEEWRTRRDP